MQGVILAGGSGTRLRPLTDNTNKHLLDVGGQPMIHHPLRSLVEAGVRDVVVVTNPQHVDAFGKRLGDGSELGLQSLRFAEQAAPGGIAQALQCAEPLVRGERCCVMLGDNLVGGSLRPFVEHFAQQPRGARVLLSHVDDVAAFARATFAGDHLVDIVEKPAEGGPGYAVTGIYGFPRDVFDICRTLAPSQRGELEISDVTRAYLKRDELSFDIHDDWWIDAGTFESLREANRLVVAGR